MKKFVYNGYIFYKDMTPEEWEELRKRNLVNRLLNMSNDELLTEYTRLACRGSKDALYASRIILKRMNGEVF